jgi:hypothetical protein
MDNPPSYGCVVVCGTVPNEMIQFQVGGLRYLRSILLQTFQAPYLDVFPEDVTAFARDLGLTIQLVDSDNRIVVANDIVDRAFAQARIAVMTETGDLPDKIRQQFVSVYASLKTYLVLSSGISVVFFDPHQQGYGSYNSLWGSLSGVDTHTEHLFNIAGPVVLFCSDKDIEVPLGNIDAAYLHTLVQRLVQIDANVRVHDNKQRKGVIKLVHTLGSNRIYSASDARSSFSDVRSSYNCDHCHRDKATKKCARCALARYCGRECQQQHWGTHKKTCRSTADVS